MSNEKMQRRIAVRMCNVLNRLHKLDPEGIEIFVKTSVPTGNVEIATQYMPTITLLGILNSILSEPFYVAGRFDKYDPDETDPDKMGKLEGFTIIEHKEEKTEK